MANGKPNLYDSLRLYFSQVAPLQMEPVLIFDTSAVIDLEQDAQRRYGLKKSHEFLDTLQQVTGATFIFPERVKEELVLHQKYHSVSGRPEISARTLEKIATFASTENWRVDLFSDEHQEKVDGTFYFARLLQQQCCNGKKLSRDPISKVDWDVIDTAISWGMFAEDSYRQNMAAQSTHPFQGVPRISVLSSDYHIYWTLGRLFGEPEGVELESHLKPMNPRLYNFMGGEQCIASNSHP